MLYCPVGGGVVKGSSPRVGPLLCATLLLSVGMHGDAVAVVVRNLRSWMGSPLGGLPDEALIESR